MKNKYPEDKQKVYIKVGRRYKELGYQWTGFPANGVWIVHDGSQSLISYIGDVPDPIPVGMLARHESVACRAISESLENMRKTGGISPLEIWRNIMKHVSKEMDAICHDGPAW